MSKENVEIVRSAWEPLERANIAEVDWDAETIRQTLGHLISPDVELRTLESGTGTGLDEVYTGLDGLAEYLRGWLEPFSEYRVEPLDYVDAGDFVLVPTKQRSVGRASGAHSELDVVFLYEIQDGVIARMVQYETLEEARVAAGEPH